MAAIWLALEACQTKPLTTEFSRTSGTIHLPGGITDLHAPLQIATGAHDIQIEGDSRGSTLHLAADFQGKAAIMGSNVTNVRVSGFRISGTRSTLVSNWNLAPSDVTFADYYNLNGLLFTHVKGLTIQGMSFDHIRAFPILISGCTMVELQGVTIQDSGTLNLKGHSNTTGGILLEQGTTHFSIKSCQITNICGNGIWTHSNYGSPLNTDGTIEGNTVQRTPRDAIQVGHAIRVRVSGNSGSDIGVPPEQVDLPGEATPVALDTAGDVRDSLYSDNHFEDVDGQCIDLDGFHDGQVLDNSCSNRKPISAYPLSHVGIVFGNSNLQMRPENVLVKGNLIEGFGYGGVYLIGERQQIIGNRFLDMNRNQCTGDMRIVHCNYAAEEPGMLRSGIYFATHAARPAETGHNVIRDNTISGFGMDRWCIQGAPGLTLSSDTILHNTCVTTK